MQFSREPWVHNPEESKQTLAGILCRAKQSTPYHIGLFTGSAALFGPVCPSSIDQVPDTLTEWRRSNAGQTVLDLGSPRSCTTPLSLYRQPHGRLPPPGAATNAPAEAHPSDVSENAVAGHVDALGTAGALVEQVRSTVDPLGQAATTHYRGRPEVQVPRCPP